MIESMEVALRLGQGILQVAKRAFTEEELRIASRSKCFQIVRCEFWSRGVSRDGGSL